MVLVAVLLVTFFISSLAYFTARTPIQKMYIIFLSIAIIVYSGIGLSYNDFGRGYTIKFFIFYLFIFLTIAFIFNLKLTKKSIIVKKYLSNRLLLFFVIGFYFVYFVRLVYPEFQLLNLIKPPIPTIQDIFNRMSAQRSAPLLEVIRLVSIISFPFFMIFLQRKMFQGKWKLVISLIVIWIYLEYVSLGYISRYEIMLYIFFIFLIFVNRDKKYYSINKRNIMFMGIILLSLSPFLLAYELFRLGVINTDINIVDSITNLIFKETDYARYYEASANMHQSNLWAKYFYWIATLPIPSAIAGPLKDNLFLINKYFTETYTGIYYGDIGYSVILPSIFGESLILYGKHFFWIHGIFLGMFFGLVCRMFEKNKELSLLNVYFAVQLIAIGRGGTSGIIGSIVNHMIFYIAITYFIKQFIISKKI